MRFIPVVLCALVLTACAEGIEDDVPLAEQIDDDEVPEFVSGIIEGSGGLLTVPEAQCVADALIESGATPEEIDSAPDGEVAQATQGCVDPTADVAVAFDGDVRKQYVAGLMTAGLSADQADCFIDGLIERGFDARDFFVGGAVPGFDEALGELSVVCV